MKIKTLNLLIIVSGLMLLMTGCPKDKYSPSLTLDIEPYVVYYNDTKYTLYDENGERDPNISSDVEKLGDIQSFIDLHSIIENDTNSTYMIYTVDDNGEFWSANYLSKKYKYPKYRVSGYGSTTPSVAVTYDESIGITSPTTGEIDLGLSSSEVEGGNFTFTYTATDEDADPTVKKVHLRVYNSFYMLDGLYFDAVSLGNSGGGGNTDWIIGNSVSYGYGEAKTVKFSVDNAVDKKMKLSALLANRALKGVIKAESDDFVNGAPCKIGTKKGNKSIIEILVKGKVMKDNSNGTLNDTYINKVITLNPTVNPDTIQTLILISDGITEDNTLKQGSIKNITLKDSEGKDIQAPFITLYYNIERYRFKTAGDNGDDIYEYGGYLWKRLSPNSGEGSWNNDIKETYIKTVYWTEDNKEAINAATTPEE